MTEIHHQLLQMQRHHHICRHRADGWQTYTIVVPLRRTVFSVLDGNMSVKAVVHSNNKCLIVYVGMQSDKVRWFLVQRIRSIHASAGFYSVFYQISKYQAQVIVQGRIIGFRNNKLCLKSDIFISAYGTIVWQNGIDYPVFAIACRRRWYAVDQGIQVFIQLFIFSVCEAFLLQPAGDADRDAAS